MLSQKIFFPTSSRLTCFLPAPDGLNEPFSPKWKEVSLPPLSVCQGAGGFSNTRNFEIFS